MTFSINSNQDIYKFAVSLHDQLIKSGDAELAGVLGEVADNCFTDNETALDAHKKVFLRIKEQSPNLPPEFSKALDSVIGKLNEI